MRWNILPILMAAALVALGGATAAAADTPVLAFYYPWYSPDNFSRTVMWDVPVSPYESDQRSTVERQVRQAREAGITGFISSWFGQGNRTDKNFATLLEVSRGTGFASTIYFETGSEGLSSQQQIVAALRYVMSTYGSHPNFARIGAKPAIFFWSPSSAGSLDTWRSIRSQVDPSGGWHWNVETDRPEQWLDVFDGVHLFSAASWAADATASYKSLKSKVEAAAARTGKPKAWAAGVAPGWDNTRQDNPTRVQIARENGGYYSRRWEAALASNPDLITVTSWNEWGEGTAIEPGTSYGDLYLDLTRKYTAVLRGAAAPGQPAPSGIQFKLGFKALADQIPNVVGQPIEEEHYGPNGDSLQRTTTGLMVWRKADNWTAFTNGARTWINGPFGVQERGNDERFDWEGAGAQR